MLSRLLHRTVQPPANEIRADLVLDSLDTAVLVIDQSGDILAANRHWHHLSEDTASQPISSRLFHEYLHPGDQSLWQQALLQHDSPVRLRLLPNSAASRWYELKLSPLHPSAPWPISITLTDVSDQMDRSRRLDADWRSLNQLVAQLPAMLYRSRNNRDWTMEYVSAGCLALTGYPPDVLTNQSSLNYGDLIHPEDADAVWDWIQEALSRRTSFEIGYRLQHADGRLLPVIEKGCGLYADNGAILGVEGVIMTFDHPQS